ncbi:hypothetical protein [Pseudoalteromonas luteoviolacea]|uniref:Uncharacterized protein n=1 Tax=Pseudoalteromonas luteoviolacea S4060-1 TaxID=1365257 RepID=A0A167MQG9_9GAMM|nr:hypothetical protein [Pseudoalteromonas luteoviolacea]KZN34895.1 hypothetical protein N480_20110 [Pseudoalteromonas luteoviolacea S2607]KZN66787.1 hypothetical protein N478_18290 [Pseudoalteromonas luteoviolacea S4060-1]
MKNKRYLIPLVFSSIAASASAVAVDQYESCNAILAGGVLDTYEQTMNFESKIALKKWVCSSEFSSGSSGGDLALDVIGIFSIGGGGGNVKEWKREHCSQDDQSYEGSKSSHVLIQKANDTIVNAWSQCMQNKNRNNLSCYAKETHDSLLMSIDLKYGIGNIVNTDIVGTNMTAKNRVPDEFRPGITNIRYTIDNKHQEAYFDLNGHADYINVSCSYTVPKKATIDANQCEVFRQQSLQKGKISAYDYTYLRDTNQVPLFSSNHGGLIGYYPCSLFTN